jgi:pSer/pThr/pTyr-binding forkhead associated (FHA) protein
MSVMKAELVVVKGKDRGVSVPLDGILTIGRSEGQSLRLKGDKKVSTSHARITADGERYFLEDLGSTNGTQVNGERILSAPLRSGDRIKIGETLLVFRVGTESVHLSDLGGRDEERSRGGDTDTHAPHYAKVPADAAKSSPGSSLEEPLLLAGDAIAGARDLRTRLDGLMRAVLHGTSAARAILFVRDPDSGALSAATAIGREGTKENAAVDADVLRSAVGGKAAGPAGDAKAVAHPLHARGTTLGALYLDDPGGTRLPHPNEERFLAGCAGAMALALHADRVERFSETALEVISLAQATLNRAPLDLVPIVEATGRLYGPVAEARGIRFETVAAGAVAILGDETLLSRALDRVVEAALVSARALIRIEVQADARIASVIVSRDGAPLAESLAQELAVSGGPAADLEAALNRLSDGGLALVRVALARSGGRLLVERGIPALQGAGGTERAGPAPAVSYVLELPVVGT